MRIQEFEGLGFRALEKGLMVMMKVQGYVTLVVGCTGIYKLLSL